MKKNKFGTEIEGYSFDDMYHSEEYHSVTLYFTTDKNILNGRYPEAEHATLSIEFNDGYAEPAWATTMISPTKDGLDYDWSEINLPYELIGKLIDVYLN